MMNKAQIDVKNKCLKMEVNVWQWNKSNWSRRAFDQVIPFAWHSLLSHVILLYPLADIQKDYLGIHEQQNSNTLRSRKKPIPFFAPFTALDT